MNDELKREFVAAFGLLPPSIRKPPATEAELQEFEAEFGAIPAEIRWFLSTLGGGAVGREWVDGIGDLAQSHRKFKAEAAQPGGWSLVGFFLIGWDGAGNPFGVALDSGAVVVEDHNFGGIHQLAKSFETFLRSGLLSAAGR